MPLPNRANLIRHQLGNGLKVVVEPDPSLPLVALNIQYHVGSKNERPGRTGLAHLFEHMLFQGSQHVDTNGHFAHIQAAGGVANGNTTRDLTTYYETLPSQHFELGLWLESDRMGFLLPALTAEKLETQRQVVMNERRLRVDNQPYGVATERIFELLYPLPHPYHWPIIGTLEDIAGATLDEVRGFFSTYYRPANAVLSLVGDLEPEAALAAVERYFGELDGEGRSVPAVARELPPLPEERRQVLEDEVALSRVYQAYRIPSCTSPGWHAYDLLAYALGIGKSSPLYRELVQESQLLQQVAVYAYSSELHGALMLSANLHQGVELAAAEAALVEQLERVAQDGPAPADFERARNRVATELYLDLERQDSRANYYSTLTSLFDDPGRLATEVDRYLEVSPAEVRQAAADVLSQGCITVGVVPRGEAE